MTLGPWFDDLYYDGLTRGKRYGTFRRALELLLPITECPEIVETGCQREADDWGAGCSTSLFADFLARQTKFGQLYSIDNSAEHLERCAGIFRKRAAAGSPIAAFKLIDDDSARWLSQASMHIDLLYLDSFDYPLGRLLEIYGGKTDIHKARAILDELGEEEIIRRHEFVVRESQEHCLREIQAAEGLLVPGSIVLIDDVLPGGGKPRLAKQWMRAKGWENVMEEYQTLWVVR